MKRHGGGNHQARKGNSYSRRARKHWLLTQFGNGEACLCVHCRSELTFLTVEADRKEPGGSYRHENIQPSCRGCNVQRSNRIDWQLSIAS